MGGLTHARLPQSEVISGLYYGMVGQSAAMRRVFERIEQLAPSRIPILIHGETGTGKEMVARALALRSDVNRLLVTINCAEITPHLTESELFGYERGAFAGATRDREGLIARANGGTLFLDEVAELSPQMQVKLLRVLETGEYRPVGANRPRQSRFRLLTATNHPLDDLSESKRLRIDLLHRLGAARIELPPLRYRPLDIPGLSERFLIGLADGDMRDSRKQLSPEAVDLLLSHGWPGNVRELRNVIEAAAVVSGSRVIQRIDVSQFLPNSLLSSTRSRLLVSLEERIRTAERDAIREALENARGDRARAAEMLGVSLSTLYRKIGNTISRTKQL